MQNSSSYSGLSRLLKENPDSIISKFDADCYCIRRESLLIDPYLLSCGDILCRCGGKVNNCQWEGKLNNFLTHYDLCDYKFIAYDLQCGKILLKKELNEHKLNMCSKRLVCCQHCNLKVKDEDMTRHLDTACLNIIEKINDEVDTENMKIKNISNDSENNFENNNEAKSLNEQATDSNPNVNPLLKNAGTVIKYAGITVGVAATIPIVMGFTTAGVAAGSIAAGIQSSIGLVSSGSLFATFTSLGMNGALLSTAATGYVTAASGFVCEKVEDLKNMFSKGDKEKSQENANK